MKRNSSNLVEKIEAQEDLINELNENLIQLTNEIYELNQLESEKKILKFHNNIIH